FIESTAALQFIDEYDRMTEVTGRRGLAQYLVRYCGENTLDSGLTLGRNDHEQTRAHSLGRFQHEILQQLRRHIPPYAEILREPLVSLCALGQCHIAAVRKSRSLIFRQFANDSGVAALDQNVGDRSGNTLTFGNCAQVALAPGPGNFDQVAVGELRRLGEDRSGNCDLVVTRQSMDDATGRVIDW